MVSEEERKVLDAIVRRSEKYDAGRNKYAVHKCQDIPRIDFIVSENSFIAIVPDNINMLRKLCDEVEVMAKKQGWK